MKKSKQRHRSGSRQPAAKQDYEIRRVRRRWRDLRRAIFGFGLSLCVVGGGLAAFKHNYDISHDLSVIGQGVPTVVQIHDPGCSLCNQLRRNASNAADRLQDRLLFRIADVTTPKGSSLQRRHEVRHVTLLLFDGDGNLRNVLEGVRGEEQLYNRFTALVERHQN